MEKFTAVLLLAAILSNMTVSVMSYGYGCNDKETRTTNCPISAQGGYDGPASFDEIFEGTPTTAPHYSDDLNSGLQDATRDVLSLAVGAIPVVGEVLTSFFGLMGNFFGGTSWEEAVDQLYEDLYQEVENLKLYVDQSIAELTVEAIKANLGGLIIAAQDCEKHTDANLMLVCIVSVRSLILGDWVYFMPYLKGSPGNRYTYHDIADLRKDASHLEHIMPMWRHYCDLLIDTGLEQIASSRHAGGQAEAEGAAVALANNIESMIEWYERALKVIKTFAITPSDFQGRACEAHTGTGCCITQHTYDQSNTEGIFGPKGSQFSCTSEYHKGCKDKSSWDKVTHDAKYYMFDPLYLNFRTVRLDAVSNYYGTQFGSSVNKWRQMRQELLSDMQ